MTGKTHALAGACLALALHGSGAEVVMTTFGALLPDVDTAQSMVGKHAKTFAKILPHRGPTHSVLMLVLATFINPWLGLGVLTHLILDMMTSVGIKLLWPWNKKFRLPFADLNVNQGYVEQTMQFLLVLISIIICLQSMSGFFSFDLLGEFDWLNQWVQDGRRFIETVRNQF